MVDIQRLGLCRYYDGFAVELLTERAYRTLDIDLITNNPRVAIILENSLKRSQKELVAGI